MSTRFKAFDGTEDKAAAPPVDPVAQAGEQDAGPAIPIGAQYLAGLHAILMTAAQFVADNSGMLEPETADLAKLADKCVMGGVATIAQKFAERYPDAPQLDGGDWTDPDAMAEEEAPGEEVPGDDEPFDAEAKEGPDDDTGEFNPKEVEGDEDDDGAEAKSADDGEDDEDDNPFAKSARVIAGMKCKAMLHRWEARKKAAKEAEQAAEAERRKLAAPDAVTVAKSACQFLRVVASDPRQAAEMRKRASVLRRSLYKALPANAGRVKAAEQPAAPAIDFAALTAHMTTAVRPLADSLGGLSAELKSLKSLTGTA